MGGAEAFNKTIETGLADEVVVGIEAQKYDSHGRIIAMSSKYGIRASVIPEFGDFYPSSLNDEVIDDLRMFTLRFSPNSNPGWCIAKRFFDILGAIVGLVIGSPFLLLGAILVKTGSPDGPVIFKQKRCGRNGKEFTMYKLRTMVPNADSMKESLQDQNEATGPVFKLKDDPRIIKHGGFLRKSSIDEIPQFLNVLKGSMSIVGPRPPLPDEVEKYDDWEWMRLAVKPGITCY